MLQLAFYGDLLAEVHEMHVVLGTREQVSFTCSEYSRYFRRLLRRFMTTLASPAASVTTDQRKVARVALLVGQPEPNLPARRRHAPRDRRNNSCGSAGGTGGRSAQSVHVSLAPATLPRVLPPRCRTTAHLRIRRLESSHSRRCPARGKSWRPCC